MRWPKAMLGEYPLSLMIGCLYHNILSYVKFFFYMLWIQGLIESSKRANSFAFLIVKMSHEIMPPPHTLSRAVFRCRVSGVSTRSRPAGREALVN